MKEMQLHKQIIKIWLYCFIVAMTTMISIHQDSLIAYETDAYLRKLTPPSTQCSLCKICKRRTYLIRTNITDIFKNDKSKHLFCSESVA